MNISSCYVDARVTMPIDDGSIELCRCDVCRED
jgi:hypothetical protein